MVLPELDWKRQPRHTLDWLVATLGSTLIAVYLFLWATRGTGYYLLVAVDLVAWFAVFFTGFWQPILYLVVAVPAVAVALQLLRDGIWRGPAGLTAVVVTALFVASSVYLLFAEGGAR